MVNILIVDDLAKKTETIKNVLEDMKINDIYIDTAQDINGAKRKLRYNNIDIMILDICLPRTFGTKVLKNGGICLLREIRESKASEFSFPKYVIALSEFTDSTDDFVNSEMIHAAIQYNPTEVMWEDELKKCIHIASKIVKNTTTRRCYDYDVAVVCALKEEVDFIASILQDVRSIKVNYDDDVYSVGYFIKNDKKIRVVFSNANQIGMVASSVLTTKMIHNFTPRYIAMTGITGGTKPDRMNFGDVIIASKTWDYRAGKDIRDNNNETRHLNTIDQVAIDATMLNYARMLSVDKKALREIKDSYIQGNKPESELQLLIGPVVSGASVVTDQIIVNDILQNQDRNVLGVEMEIYGMYYAANWALNPRPKMVAVKAVSDFANSDKGDEYHKYASYTSAKVLERLAKEYFVYED